MKILILGLYFYLVICMVGFPLILVLLIKTYKEKELAYEQGYNNGWNDGFTDPEIDSIER